MGDKTSIEWSDATWNCIYGCSRVSPGCVNCYAERFIHRFSGPGQRYDGLTVIRSNRPGWTGKIQLRPDRLDIPMRWQRPRKIFVNSLSDVFHENVPFEYVAAMFTVMGMADRHQFQVLTKRHDRMLEFFHWAEGRALPEYAREYGVEVKSISRPWPLPNVWLGVSVENQEMADIRIPKLLETPAAIRWISAEPLIGEVDIAEYTNGLDWVVVGGESGPCARPMDPKWVDGLREQCEEAEIPFHFKQWGMISNNPDSEDPTAKKNGGGIKGGRLFLGRTWDDEPVSLNAP